MNFSEQVNLTNMIADEKRALIGSLILLVIQYNSYYRYDVTNRNCQHFVLDALSVLQVELPQEWPGDLDDYYTALVKGKTPSIPPQFETHSDLDARASKGGEEALANLPQHELEFLLAMYLHFHLEDKAQLKGDTEALGAWQCEETGCCMGEVERLIKVKSMQVHDLETT